MKLFALEVLYKGPDGKIHLLKAAYEVEEFGYFQRGSVKEFMDFSARVIVERSVVGSRSSTKEKDYVCHAYIRTDALSGVLISDGEYPKRVAHTLLTKVLDEFASKISKSLWASEGNDSIPFTQCDVYLAKYQNPSEADAMTKLQQDLDETKIILHNTMDSILERGEKLDDLVDKSADLSVQSKAFYKTAKKANSCCVIL